MSPGASLRDDYELATRSEATRYHHIAGGRPPTGAQVFRNRSAGGRWRLWSIQFLHAGEIWPTCMQAGQIFVLSDNREIAGESRCTGDRLKLFTRQFPDPGRAHKVYDNEINSSLSRLRLSGGGRLRDSSE